MADRDHEIERAKYTEAWNHAAYRERSPGMRFLNDALDKLKPADGASFLDIGCGTGRVSAELTRRGYDVTATDIAANACDEFDGPLIIAPIWDFPHLAWFDFGFCADVMEHLPTEKVDASLACIAASCNTVYFQIANFEDHGEMVGGGLHLHLTVEPMRWWLEKIRANFNEVAAWERPKHHILIGHNPAI